MNTTNSLAEHNIFNLNEGIRLVSSTDDETYRSKHNRLGESSIGEHVRHVIEHYLCFLQGAPVRSIDYDARDRDLRISDDRNFALLTLRRIVHSMHNLPDEDDSVMVKVTSGVEQNSEHLWSRSTLRRELQYLQAHTIHHYALISMILRAHGLDTPDAFGVAPSTLKHRMAVR